MRRIVRNYRKNCAKAGNEEDVWYEKVIEVEAKQKEAFRRLEVELKMKEVSMNCLQHELKGFEEINQTSNEQIEMLNGNLDKITKSNDMYKKTIHDVNNRNQTAIIHGNEGDQKLTLSIKNDGSESGNKPI